MNEEQQASQLSAMFDGELPPQSFIDRRERAQLGEEFAVLGAQLAALFALFLQRRLQ